MRAESLLVAAMALVTLPVVMSDAFLGGPSATFVVVPHNSLLHSESSIVELRGGAGDKEEIEFESSDEELEEEESEDEDEEEMEETEDLDPKLAKSAQAKAASVKTKMAKVALKAAVSASVPKKAKKKSSISLFHIPYIIKACMNPFTLMKMTRAYFASLIQLDYLKETEDSSQNLRSALEQKAKKGGGGNRGKRKFKPGQSKSLSDLPVLNT